MSYKTFAGLTLSTQVFAAEGKYDQQSAVAHSTSSSTPKASGQGRTLFWYDEWCGR